MGLNHSLCLSMESSSKPHENGPSKNTVGFEKKEFRSLSQKLADLLLSAATATAAAMRSVGPLSSSASAVATSRRHYATKYTARIVSGTATGRSVSAEVSPAPPLPADIRGYPLPRRELICNATNMILRAESRPSARGAELDSFSQLASYLCSLSISLTSSEASEIMKSLNCPSVSLKFFQSCPSISPNFRHDALTYNRILLILSKSVSPNRFEQVRSIVDEMERTGTRGNISTVNILIWIFGDTKDLEKCKELVRKWDLKMTSYTYKSLLQAYLRSYDADRAFDVYMEMRWGGYKLDIFAYNMLLDALAKNEKVDRACRVFEDMKKKHCEPDGFSYTIMIRMYGKTGQPSKSLAFFQEMSAKGHVTNLIVYNTVIEALAKGGDVERALLLFSEMVEKELRPNEFTYSVILNLLATKGQLGRLSEVLKFSRKYMNKSIYAYLVRALSKLGHASEAHEFFCDMWVNHETGDRAAFLSMLENFCNTGKITEAIDLLENIEEKGIKPDTFMYNMVLSALGKSRKILVSISHIHDLYERMKKNGPTPDIYTYNVLISSFGRAGKVQEAVQVFEELEQSECRPDIISYNSIINCLGKNGDLDEAHIKFKEMKEKGLSPDVVTYSTLIECFGKTDRIDMACRLFDEMSGEGCRPNIVTYNILLDCLEMCGRTAQAVDLYARLKEHGLTPDSITYSILERLQSGSHRKVRIRRKSPITGWVVSPLK
ncbi:hypothetical protein SAY86_008928 [Trapa natans]|uniref:Pentatricopeptide repeat-containing protein n=1 Tax=Trapa natans TaxID=22666 RepID=A0AAN7QF45_TRANT|nr:hypothetical protein SAY86_008928 [Trapa natans]